MQQPVLNARFVNIARLRVIDPERLIGTVLIGFVSKFAVQGEDIVDQMNRKSFDVLSATLIAEKFTPRGEQIFRRNDIMVDMTRPHFPLSLSRFRFDFESDQRGILDLG